MELTCSAPYSNIKPPTKFIDGGNPFAYVLLRSKPLFEECKISVGSYVPYDQHIQNNIRYRSGSMGLHNAFSYALVVK